MGSGSSKKVKNVANVKTASLAFEDAGRQAAIRRDEETQNNNQRGDAVGINSTSQETKPVPSSHDAAQHSNGHVVLQEHKEEASNEKHEEVDEEMPSKAVLKIQSVFRGHQDRQLLKKQSDMAIKIQRRFRRHRSEQNTDEEATVEEAEETEEISKKELEARKDQREHRVRAWKDDTPELLRRTYSIHVGEKTQEEFKMFQDEITGLRWKAEQQIERNVYGETHSPRRVLFISSNVQKSTQLAEARLEDVLTFHYDFTIDTFDSLVRNLEVNLEAYQPGSKARSICFVSQGGPGVLYLLKRRALTVQKLKKETEADQVRFWESIGKCMSKVRYKESIIHVMGCNVTGNEKGEKLLHELEQIMTPAIVQVKAPLELSEEGQDMISSYFDLPKYKTWKMRRYSKTE